MLYGTAINRVGLLSDKPLKLKKNGLDKDRWWVISGLLKDDFDFTTIGLEIGDGCIRYTSFNKKDIESFIIGAKAAYSIISQQCTYIYPL